MPLLYETITAMQLKPTDTRIYLWNEAKTERMEGKTVDVGTKILVRAALFHKVNGLTGLSGKILRIHGRLNTGEWKLLYTAPTDANAIDMPYTLTQTGQYTFYAEFLGDHEYASSKSSEAKIGSGVPPFIPVPFPKEYLIAAGLTAAGLIFVGLAFRRR